MRLICTCSPGLERLLELEIDGLLGKKSSPEQPNNTGAVHFEAKDWAQVAQILLGSRLASRLLLSLRAFSAKNPAMLYDQVRRVEWAQIIPPDTTFAVATHGTGEGLEYPLSFATLKIKDAICDEIKKQGRLRPNIDRKTPDVSLEAFFLSGRCELSVDLAGFPLHRRGYRLAGSEAPLRENRAAAMLAFAGYTGKEKLVDPFCGSGTIAIEAALIALKRAPGLQRKVADFAASKIYPEAATAIQECLKALYAESDAAEEITPEIYASDILPSAIEAARGNASRAKVTRSIKLEKKDARQIQGENLFIVTNPPFGDRVMGKEKAVELLSAFTRQIKHHCPNSKLTLILAADKSLEKAIGLRPSRKLTIENGPTPARFLAFELYQGSKK